VGLLYKCRIHIVGLAGKVLAQVFFRLNTVRQLLYRSESGLRIRTRSSYVAERRILGDCSR
jgi:hypothetical protein